MKEKNKNLVKYDYSNPKSQKLFEEFMLLITEITRYVEDRDKRIDNLNRELIEATRIRYMVKIIIRKLSKTLLRVVSFLPRKVLTLLKRE